ncbi:hypothetical protein GCM10010946_11430 [Undibacterium squillarum]|uniref:Uncharacterized protein n=1 Tax=Undibacterium squillarum TaxID=1131567 RepID=A0ABQ2XW26_9BURK|nr:hypothetical protein GCM10010946_11430 [Undibacterium squillarum]
MESVSGAKFAFTGKQGGNKVRNVVKTRQRYAQLLLQERETERYISEAGPDF